MLSGWMPVLNAQTTRHLWSGVSFMRHLLSLKRRGFRILRLHG